MTSARNLLFILPLAGGLCLSACSSDSGGGGGGGGCKDNEVEVDGDCVDYAYRFEPKDRLDFDNTVVFDADGNMTHVSDNPEDNSYAGDKVKPFLGGMPEDLDYPADSPKSGFRLVLPRIEMGPGEELLYCVAWALPEFANRYVYTSELHTSAGVHHANMYAMKVGEARAMPYPNCGGVDAAAVISDSITNILTGQVGSVTVPTVMMPMSTQTVGRESFVQPDGYGFNVPADNEILMEAHLLNPTDDTLVVEAVWDYYTLPQSEVEHETKPFMWTWLDFTIPANSKKTVTATCPWYGGEVLAAMPHMHQWGEAFDASFLDDSDKKLRKIYSKQDTNTDDSDAVSFNPGIDGYDATQIQYSCHYNNNLDHDMKNGNGENEMCFLFGFMSPPENAAIGLTLTEGAPCWSFNYGRPESLEGITLTDLLATLDPDVLAKVLEMFGN